MRPFQKIPKTVLMLGAASLFTDISSEGIYSILPLFLTQVLGAGPLALGVIEGIAETTASLLKVFFRNLDRPGQAAQTPGALGLWHLQFSSALNRPGPNLAHGPLSSIHGSGRQGDPLLAPGRHDRRRNHKRQPRGFLRTAQRHGQRGSPHRPPYRQRAFVFFKG